MNKQWFAIGDKIRELRLLEAELDKACDDASATGNHIIWQNLSRKRANIMGQLQGLAFASDLLKNENPPEVQNPSNAFVYGPVFAAS